MFATEETHTYFIKDTPIFTENVSDYSDSGLLFSLFFSMSPDIIFEERSIYTFWDLLGDIGGLFGSLTFLGTIVMSVIELIVGSKMSQFITAQLFTIERKRAKVPAVDEPAEVLKSIRKRKAADFSLSGWLFACCDRKKKIPQEMAEEQTGKHIDIVNLIRSQMVDIVTRRLHFNKMDRYLIRHQFRPFTLSTRKIQSSESSDFEMENFMLESTDYRARLVQGLYAV